MTTCKICDVPLTGRQRTLCSDPVCKRRNKTDWQLSWQKDNPDKHTPNVKAYNVRHPDKRRARRSREAGRVRAAQYGSPHEDYSVSDLVAMLPGTCYLCGGSDGPMGWDHVTPLILGGADALHNIKPAHGPCNVRKGVKEVI